MYDKDFPPQFDKNSDHFYIVLEDPEVKETCEALKLPVEKSRLCFEQVFWLANMDPFLIGKHAHIVYKWLEKNMAKAFIPIDYWRKVMGNE